MAGRQGLGWGLARWMTLVAGVAAGAVERPNILFCIADDASYAQMGNPACAWVRTPGFDRVARDGVRFRNAYTPNAKCAPSRACIITGRNSWQLEAAANHWCYFPTTFRSYPEVLQSHGYHVGFTGKGWAPGIAKHADGRPRDLLGPGYQRRRLKPPTRGIAPFDYAANFKDFLDARPEERPFCFWYGGKEPHRGYEYGSGIAKGGKRIEQVDRVPAFWPDREVTRTDLLDYAYEVEYFDRHLQRMLAELETRGLLDNTLVVVTADNGMPFPRIKGQAYEYSNHLPLAMMWPRGIVHPSREIDDFVAFIDLAPTFLEVAGVTEHDMAAIQGRSLLPLLATAQSGRVDPTRDHVLIGKERHDIGRPHDVGYPIRGIRQGDYLYVVNFKTERWPAGNPETGYLNCDGSPTKTEILRDRREQRPGAQRYWDLCFGKRIAEELYRIDRDPDCLTNLAAEPSEQGLKRRLRERLFAELRAQGDPRVTGQGDVFDAYPYADDSGRGFYERFQRGETLNFGWVNRSDFEPEPLD